VAIFGVGTKLKAAGKITARCAIRLGLPLWLQSQLGDDERLPFDVPFAADLANSGWTPPTPAVPLPEPHSNECVVFRVGGVAA
jgi:hypothetical protein